MNPYAILAAILLMGGIAFGAHHKGVVSGRLEVQSAWDKSKLAQSEANNQAIQAAVAKVDAAQKLDIAQTQKVVANYETALDTKNAQITAARRAADADRLRFHVDRAAVCPGAASGTKTASAVNPDDPGAPAVIELPPEIARRVLDIGEDADRQIAERDAKLAGLRAWVRSHGFYGDSVGLSGGDGSGKGISSP